MKEKQNKWKLQNDAEVGLIESSSDNGEKEHVGITGQYSRIDENNGGNLELRYAEIGIYRTVKVIM